MRAFLLFIEHLGPARVFILRLVLLVDVARRKTESHCFGRLALICSSHVGQLVGGVLGRFLGLEFGGTIHVVDVAVVVGGDDALADRLERELGGALAAR